MDNQPMIEEVAAKANFGNVLVLECQDALKDLKERPQKIYIINDALYISVDYGTTFSRGSILIDWILLQEHDGDLEKVLDTMPEETPVAIFPSSQNVHDYFEKFLAKAAEVSEGYHLVGDKLVMLIERACYKR